MFIRLLVCILPYVHSSALRYFTICSFVCSYVFCLMFICLLICILPYVHSSARMYFVLCSFVCSYVFCRMFIRLHAGILPYVHSSARMYFVLCSFVCPYAYCRMFIRLLVCILFYVYSSSLRYFAVCSFKKTTPIPHTIPVIIPSKLFCFVIRRKFGPRLSLSRNRRDFLIKSRYQIVEISVAVLFGVCLLFTSTFSNGIFPLCVMCVNKDPERTKTSNIHTSRVC